MWRPAKRINKLGKNVNGKPVRRIGGLARAMTAIIILGAFSRDRSVTGE